VADAFERALTDALQARLPPEQRPQLHLAWGRLTDDELVEVHRRGVEQVLRPAVDALLAATG
jgi:hypothetical protein